MRIIGLFVLALSTSFGAVAACAQELPDNKWVKVNIDFGKTLKEYLGDKTGNWSTTDGYSDSVYRSKDGSVVIRTGVRCKDLGLSPGFYTNASVEWDLKTDTAKVIDVAPWGGGSGGFGRLLPAYQQNKAPTPRHTYDGICYVPESDKMYMMLGANWRIGGRGANEEARAELKKDGGRTWAYSFAENRWECIEDNVWKHFKCSPYENHMTYWPAGKKLLFFNDGGNKYAQFDLATKKWASLETTNECPMSLYNARSTWDSKRSLWVFRLGPRLCTFDPKTNSFEALPNCYEMKIPTREELKQMRQDGVKPDGRLTAKGVCYNSKHDCYLVCGPTGNDTAVYDPETKKWTAIEGGEIKLVNGYMQYDPQLDVVAMNYQLSCFKFKYAPGK